MQQNEFINFNFVYLRFCNHVECKCFTGIYTIFIIVFPFFSLFQGISLNIHSLLLMLNIFIYNVIEYFLDTFCMVVSATKSITQNFIFSYKFCKYICYVYYFLFIINIFSLKGVVHSGFSHIAPNEFFAAA